MSDSDSGFDDDDDELLLGLLQASSGKPQAAPAAASIPAITQVQPAQPASSNLASDSALIRAQGEISILRAQLEALQSAKNEELHKMNSKLDAAQNSSRDHISALKQTVDKLEDEKKFLANEIRALSGTKRRKYNGSSGTEQYPTPGEIEPENTPKFASGAQAPNSRATSTLFTTAGPPKIQLDDDWSQLCSHIWNYTINGGSASSVDFLSRICLEDALVIQSASCTIEEKTPISSTVWTVLLGLKKMRLDAIITRFCQVIFEVVSELLRREHYAAVPFLLSLVHGCINFKTSAVRKDLAVAIVSQVSLYMHEFLHVLQGEEEFGDVRLTDQTRLLQHATLLFCFDLLENTVVICTQFGPSFIPEMWAQNQLQLDLMKRILPENTERFVSAAQINLVYNFIEVLSASMSEEGLYAGFCNQASANLSIVKSLIKVLLIDIPPKSDFSFYGLNRMIGNNHDFLLLEQAIPKHPREPFWSGLVSLPFPIHRPEFSEKDKTRVLLAHETHLLTLRLHIVKLLESVVVSGSMDLLNSKENIKSVTRIIGFEQNLILHQPRDKKVYMRIEIIGGLIRILYYIIEEYKNINDLIFPETLYEVFVILMRIAFSSDSLSLEAHALLSEIRKRGVTDIGVFNRECEWRSRDVAHFNLHDPRPNKFAELANIEGDFANGLEFPYDSETVEIAREILAVCVNHDEADNLYYNMTRSQ